MYGANGAQQKHSEKSQEDNNSIEKATATATVDKSKWQNIRKKETNQNIVWHVKIYGTFSNIVQILTYFW